MPFSFLSGAHGIFPPPDFLPVMLLQYVLVLVVLDQYSQVPGVFFKYVASNLFLFSISGKLKF